jgi:hypothetical protein
MLRALVIVLLVLSGSSAAHAEKRVALVIGNSAYVKVAKLSNPARDAELIEALFRKAGFDVVEAKRDLGMVAMRRALRDFADRVRGADIAAVFFAGHGMEMNGTNYLVPVDAVLERDTDVEDETISLERVTRLLEGACGSSSSMPAATTPSSNRCGGRRSAARSGEGLRKSASSPPTP